MAPGADITAHSSAGRSAGAPAFAHIQRLPRRRAYPLARSPPRQRPPARCLPYGSAITSPALQRCQHDAEAGSPLQRRGDFLRHCDRGRAARRIGGQRVGATPSPLTSSTSPPCRRRPLRKRRHRATYSALESTGGRGDAPARDSSPVRAKSRPPPRAARASQRNVVVPRRICRRTPHRHRHRHRPVTAPAAAAASRGGSVSGPPMSTEERPAATAAAAEMITSADDLRAVTLVASLSRNRSPDARLVKNRALGDLPSASRFPRRRPWPFVSLLPSGFGRRRFAGASRIFRRPTCARLRSWGLAQLRQHHTIETFRHWHTSSGDRRAFFPARS